MKDGLAILNSAGQLEANKLIRAHRLWESYLVTDVGLTEEQIHDEAEDYEHRLTEDLLEEVDAHLGYPALDPHGAPIPDTRKQKDAMLSQASHAQRVSISSRQDNSYVASQLWSLGLVPGETILIKDSRNNSLILESEDGKIIEVDNALAVQVHVDLVD